MLRQIFKFYSRRNFSYSAVLKDSKKEITNTPQKEAQTTPPQGTPFKTVQADFVPSNFEKFILVYSGKYKSKDEIPPRIGYHTIDTAKSKVRIKISNYLMIGTLCMCAFYVWLGKKKAKAGETIVAMGKAERNRILEKAGIKREI